MYYLFILYPTSLPIAYEQVFNSKLISPKELQKTQYNLLSPKYFVSNLFCHFQYGVKHLSISTQMSIIPIVNINSFTNTPPPEKNSAHFAMCPSQIYYESSVGNG